MSREIKFRAYWTDSIIEEISRMQYSDDKVDCGQFLSIAQSDLLALGPNSVHIMQYTGLKDKNGVEIYFDDILQDENGNKYHCTYHDLAPTMIFKGLGCDTHHHILYCTIKEYEVIDNIHENKLGIYTK